MPSWRGAQINTEISSPCFAVYLNLNLLTWTIWRAPTNVSKWRMGFNSAFKGVMEINANYRSDQAECNGKFR
jgi:hypothetical protein